MDILWIFAPRSKANFWDLLRCFTAAWSFMHRSSITSNYLSDEKEMPIAGKFSIDSQPSAMCAHCVLGHTHFLHSVHLRRSWYYPSPMKRHQKCCSHTTSRSWYRSRLKCQRITVPIHNSPEQRRYCAHIIIRCLCEDGERVNHWDTFQQFLF